MKMVVADDEILTLQLMEKIIDWKSKGIEIAGLAQNGKEALELVNNECPDILITDIKMPQIDGLELIKQIRNRNSSLKIVIISAYSEFEYAQRALSYGVSGYLLKPLDEDKLENMINTIISEITKKKLQDQNYEYIDMNNPNASVINTATGHTSSVNEKENNRLIQKAKEYINKNYDKNITLETICDSISVSKNYFCYLFKKVMGISIWDYLTHMRVEKAKELLKQTDLKNYEISYKVGYENPSYFTKTFKKLTGLTPQEFRDRN